MKATPRLSPRRRLARRCRHPHRRHRRPAQAAACNGYVGLTFDDGPSSSTPALLNALTQNGLRATMFNQGQYAAAYPARVRAQVIWNVDSQDWNGASTDAIVAAAGRLTNGQVILMHDWSANSLAAIPRIAQGLAARGLCAGTVNVPGAVPRSARDRLGNEAAMPGCDDTAPTRLPPVRK